MTEILLIMAGLAAVGILFLNKKCMERLSVMFPPEHPRHILARRLSYLPSLVISIILTIFAIVACVSLMHELMGMADTGSTHSAVNGFALIMSVLLSLVAVPMTAMGLAIALIVLWGLNGLVLAVAAIIVSMLGKRRESDRGGDDWPIQ